MIQTIQIEKKIITKKGKSGQQTMCALNCPQLRKESAMYRGDYYYVCYLIATSEYEIVGMIRGESGPAPGRNEPRRCDDCLRLSHQTGLIPTSRKEAKE